MRWLGLVLVFFAAIAASCATVELKGPPPKHDAGLFGDCPKDPIIECDAGPAGDDQACGPEPDAGGWRAQIPQGKSYPGGCIVDFPDPVPLAATGECKLIAQCKCMNPLATNGTAWTCIP
jgi:hypothetical protein